MHNIAKLPLNIQKCCYCTKPATKTNPYSHTVLLPKTKLPLRLEGNKLVERDKNVFKLGGFENLYNWQKTHLKGPEYVLHDGPPYANGKPHMGHAINKILKDVILRYKMINGTRVHYVPGWDCHGLPIELKALSNSKNLDPIEIRSKARNFAEKTVKNQMETFKSWGVIGDWDNHYKTSSVDYVKNQLNQFFKLYEQGFVYRDFKPIYWSPSSRTALAEAELEYNESHKSPSVYLRIQLKSIPKVPSLTDKRKTALFWAVSIWRYASKASCDDVMVYAIIWTTTPWTLPSNQAVCYNDSLSYCLIKKSDPKDTDLYIIATELFESFCNETATGYQLLGVHSGDMLLEATYAHPIYSEKTCNFLHSSHATGSKGTGLVHTAPAHGPDDFLVALNNRISIVDLVNDDGCYKNEAGDYFQGKFVLTEGNEVVLKLLEKDVLHFGMIEHSYPYDWRTKQPVIIKASKQWFINTEKLKKICTGLLEKVIIIPSDKSDRYKKYLIGQLQKRSYWCISRQRKWGVPLPVFYNKHTEKVIFDHNILNHLCNLLSQHGTDFWWKLSLKDLLPSGYANDIDSIQKGEDILDIWFDSGISWSQVLPHDKIADLYLEGVDQFTGWFQSSLITSAALRNQAPFKAVFVHGFAVDKNGVKMSKSVGNVVDPVEVTNGKKGQKPYGVDALRWWVACHANQVVLAHVSDNILDQSKDEVQKIRSVLRFSLGAICDYELNENDQKHLLLIDKYMLHSLYQFNRKSRDHIENFNFHRINTTLAPFLANTVSGLYLSAIKDRLYCDSALARSRKSAQYTLLQLFYTVSQSIAGILPHFVEELYSFLPQRNSDSFFTKGKYDPSENWENFEVEKVMNLVLEVKKEVNKLCEANTVSMEVEVQFRNADFQLLMLSCTSIDQLELELRDIFQVSKVWITQMTEKDGAFKVNVFKSERHSCPRCRCVYSEEKNELCLRCKSVLKESQTNNKNAVAG